VSLLAAPLPPGLIYLDDWLSADEHDSVVAEIDSKIFETSLIRRVQHYGARYEYGSAEIAERGSAPSIPPVMAFIGERLVTQGFFDKPPEQVIVNEYLSGQGIAPHVDRDSFGPAVAIISLIESWPMTFKYLESGDEFELFLEVKSLAVMTKQSRFDWSHEIKKRKFDDRGGLKIRRGRRLSLTYRTINEVLDPLICSKVL